MKPAQNPVDSEQMVRALKDMIADCYFLAWELKAIGWLLKQVDQNLSMDVEPSDEGRDTVHFARKVLQDAMVRHADTIMAMDGKAAALFGYGKTP